MRRTSLTQHQANELAKMLRERRSEAGYSVRALAAAAEVNLATIVKLERGEILTPQPDTLRGLARALGLRMSDLLVVADWLPADELPTVGPYLRSQYRDLPAEDVANIESFIQSVTEGRGIKGPIDGEDEK